VLSNRAARPTKETDRSSRNYGTPVASFCDGGCYGENSLQYKDGLGNGEVGVLGVDWWARSRQRRPW
jgi:hypothetical protein